MRSRFLYLGENRVREFKEIKEIKEFKDYIVAIITKLSKLTKHKTFLSLTPNFLSEWCGSGASQKKKPKDSTR